MYGALKSLIKLKESKEVGGNCRAVVSRRAAECRALEEPRAKCMYYSTDNIERRGMDSHG